MDGPSETENSFYSTKVVRTHQRFKNLIKSTEWIDPLEGKTFPEGERSTKWTDPHNAKNHSKSTKLMNHAKW